MGSTTTWLVLCAWVVCAIAMLRVGLAAAQPVTPHVVSPHALAPHVVTPPPAPAPSQAASSPPAAAAGEGVESFLTPACNVENPCTPEQRQVKEILEAQRGREEEERLGPFAGRMRELEALRALEEERNRIGVVLRHFATQLICPLYTKALEVVSDARTLLVGLGIPEGEVLAAAEAGIAASVGERACITTLEP